MPFSAKAGFFSQQAAPTPANWTPAQITTQTWLQAQASDLTLSGSDITNWTNNANGTNTTDYSQATASKQPTWDSANSAVRFTTDPLGTPAGVGQYLQADSAHSFSGADAITVVSVIDIVGYSAQFGGEADKFFQQAGNPSGGSTGVWSVSAGKTVGWNNRFNNGYSAFGNEVTGAKKLVSSSLAASTGYASAKMFLDGTDLGSRSAGSNDFNVGLSNAYSYVGGGPGGSPNQFMYANAKMYELVCYEGSDDTNRQLLEGYMAWEHGIEGNLPTGHPYKNARPTV